jgi:hypothetical protein
MKNRISFRLAPVRLVPPPHSSISLITTSF